MPPIGIIVAVVLTDEFLGPVTAGLVYLSLTGFVLFGIYTSAKHWNIPYTAGFVFSAFLLFGMVPDVVSGIVHPFFGVLGQLLIIVFLIGMAVLLFEKSGVADLFNDF